MNGKRTDTGLENIEDADLWVAPSSGASRSPVGASTSSDDQPIDPTPVNASAALLTRVRGTKPTSVTLHLKKGEKPVARVEMGKYTYANPVVPVGRKNAVRTTGWEKARRSASVTLGEQIGLQPEDLPEFPVDDNGVPVCSPELMESLFAFIAAGGMLVTFARVAGVPRTKLQAWVRSKQWSEAYAAAKSDGYDALAEETIEIASMPVFIEESCVSYGADGSILRRDVRTTDAVTARQLAVKTRIDLLKRWAPDRYGDKVEVKSDGTMASRIIAARSRVLPPDSTES